MIEIQENISLKEYTTFDIGGVARFFVEVHTIDEFKEALCYAQEHALTYFILAGGSNILFSDDGFNGIVIKMALREISYSRDTVQCEAGVPLLEFVYACAEKDLGGLQNLAGVPGSVGGAVRGNAGAFGCEISDCITSVHVFDVDSGEEKELRKEECQYEYRNSVFKKVDRYIILSINFTMQEMVSQELYAQMNSIIEQRNAKHIQDIKSAGSFFMNPVVLDDVRILFEKEKSVESKGGRVPAGWLLERVGLEQKSIGDIVAGEMHANYFLNEGNGTAEHVMQLASLAKTRVRDKFGVQLKEEVTMVGFDN